jgi:hypothetical protein
LEAKNDHCGAFRHHHRISITHDPGTLARIAAGFR